VIWFLNKTFIRLMAVAFLIAIPASDYAILSWLKEFPYRVPLYWWVFALAGVLTLVITIITVSYQSWKAATQNPVNSLKLE
jgi:putative ABC transport system permease protein